MILKIKSAVHDMGQEDMSCERNYLKNNTKCNWTCEHKTKNVGLSVCQTALEGSVFSL